MRLPGYQEGGRPPRACSPHWPAPCRLPARAGCSPGAWSRCSPDPGSRPQCPSGTGKGRPSIGGSNRNQTRIRGEQPHKLGGVAAPSRLVLPLDPRRSSCLLPHPKPSSQCPCTCPGTAPYHWVLIAPRTLCYQLGCDFSAQQLVPCFSQSRLWPGNNHFIPLAAYLLDPDRRLGRPLL